MKIKKRTSYIRLPKGLYQVVEAIIVTRSRPEPPRAYVLQFVSAETMRKAWEKHPDGLPGEIPKIACVDAAARRLYLFPEAPKAMELKVRYMILREI